MKLSLPTGLAAGILALAAAPALAAPTATVRVEGATATLVDSARVTSRAVVRGGHECADTSVAGALDAATAGDWVGHWNDAFEDFYVPTIRGESPAGNSYWSLWVNHRLASLGVCQSPLQEGDDVLFFVDRCDFDGQGCANQPVEPLELTAPATVKQGVATELTVVRYNASGSPRAAAGARITGPGVDATTNASGHAAVTFADTGTVRIRAEQAGAARSAGRTITVTAADGAPAPAPAPGPVPALAAPDRTPPVATLLRRGTRQLRGSFAADPSGIRMVKLRLTRRYRGVCRYFSGRMERFRRTRCGTGAYFAIGDRAEWSYLLPQRLERGRYVLDAVAIDGAGNRTPLERGRTRVVFKVR